jgi:hypothetical protein
MSPRDLYADGRHVAKRLSDSGHLELARRIADEIDGGSTSSEILFGLRSVLDQALGVLRPDDDARPAASELRKAIDRTLGDTPL